MAWSLRSTMCSTFFSLDITIFPLISTALHRRANVHTIAYEEIGSPASESSVTAFVLHGLLGSGRNWRSFARSLSSLLASSYSVSNLRMILVDLRSHGRSLSVGSLHPPHDLVNAANDLADLVKFQKWRWPDIVIGHSLGGKIAMQFAESCSNGCYGRSAILPKQLWILDSIPGEINTEESCSEVDKILKTLSTFPSPIPSRKWVVEEMTRLGFPKSQSQWMGSNLTEAEDGQSKWSFDISAAYQLFHSYRKKMYWGLLENPPKGLKIEMVRAEESDRWDSQTRHRVEALAAEGKLFLHSLPLSGHWVHVDNPTGLLQIMAPRIASLITTSTLL